MSGSRRSGSSRRSIGRWDRGVDLKRFDPGLRDDVLLPGRDQRALRRAPDQGEGRRPARRRLSRGAGARSAAAPGAGRRRPRGGGPARAARRRTRPSSAGSTAPSSHASTRAPTCSCSRAAPTPSARWCSRPRPAACRSSRSAEGGPATLIEHGETGLLAVADPAALADALQQIVDSPLLAERLRRAALAAVSGRTWEAAIGAAGRRLPPCALTEIAEAREVA